MYYRHLLAVQPNSGSHPPGAFLKMISDLQQHNYYQVLGVSSNVTQSEIDLAYKRLVSRFDSSQSNLFPKSQGSLKDKIALLQEAYDTLSNKEKRQSHDRYLKELKGKAISLVKSASLKTSGVTVRKAEPEEPKPKQKGKNPNVYQDYFGFSEKPFDLTPDPKYLYLSPKHKEVLAHLVYGLQENNGFLKIVGEVGTGKTMICRSFLRELHEDFSIAYIFNPCIDEVELLQTINDELGLPSGTNSRKKLIDILNRFLLLERKRGHRVVIIIDEAQDLHPSVMEQLRLLSNLETETEKLIQIVLIGQPELDTLLNGENLRQLRQRITIQWELMPLNTEETRGYIQHRLNVALGKGKVRFDRSAMDMIYRFSGGIPRMINVVSDRSLLIGYTQNTRKITNRIVRQAVKDIGGLAPVKKKKTSVWTVLIPLLAIVGIVSFVLNQFVLPDLQPKTAGDQNIASLIQEDPIDLTDPGKLISQEEAALLPETTGSDFQPIVPNSNSMQVIEPPPVRIAAQGPLSIVQPEKLITYLSSLSLVESRVEAAKWVLKSWGMEENRILELDESNIDRLDEEFELLSFDVSGNLDRLINLNYPAILEIALPNAQGTKYMALTAIDGNQGTFGSVDQIVMPFSTIDSMWTRKAIVLWKDFEYLPEKLEDGFTGKEAVWLQKNLRLLGFFQGREAPKYGGKTVSAVVKFQRQNGIRDDGRFQTDSKMMLYGLLDIYPTPKLVQP
jgi:general secretion pathway protein A